MFTVPVAIERRAFARRSVYTMLRLLVALLLNLSDDAGDLLLRAVGVHDGHAAMATPRAAAPPVERAPPVELAAPAFSMAARVGGGGGGAPT